MSARKKIPEASKKAGAAPAAVAQFAIVELVGRERPRIAGRVSEQLIGSVAMLRIDVPAIGDRKAYAELLGAASIWRLRFVDEAAALDAAGEIAAEAVRAPARRALHDIEVGNQEHSW